MISLDGPDRLHYAAASIIGHVDRHSFLPLPRWRQRALAATIDMMKEGPPRSLPATREIMPATPGIFEVRATHIEWQRYARAAKGRRARLHASRVRYKTAELNALIVIIMRLDFHAHFHRFTPGHATDITRSLRSASAFCHIFSYHA